MTLAAMLVPPKDKENKSGAVILLSAPWWLPGIVFFLNSR